MQVQGQGQDLCVQCRDQGQGLRRQGQGQDLYVQCPDQTQGLRRQSQGQGQDLYVQCPDQGQGLRRQSQGQYVKAHYKQQMLRLKTENLPQFSRFLFRNSSDKSKEHISPCICNNNNFK